VVSDSSTGGMPGPARRRGYVLAAGLLVVMMLGGTLPIPLYVLYEKQMGLGPLGVTVDFVAYVRSGQSAPASTSPPWWRSSPCWLSSSYCARFRSGSCAQAAVHAIRQLVQPRAGSDGRLHEPLTIGRRNDRMAAGG
jgi:hypothetical protein